MAKKKQQLVDMTFHFSETYKTIPDAIYKQITLKQGGLRFFHIERKGNTWLVLDALEFVEEGAKRFVIPFLKDPESAVPRNMGMTIGGSDVVLTIHTSLNLPREELYHLDELPDGTWRVTYTDTMLDHPHGDLYSIIGAMHL